MSYNALISGEKEKNHEGRIASENYREPSPEEWRLAASDPKAWEMLVAAAERHEIEHEESAA
jgi:hypothetical protein